MKSKVCYVYLCKFTGLWHSNSYGRQKGSGCDSCGGRGINMRWPTQSFSASIYSVFVRLLLYLLLRIIHEYTSYCTIGNSLLVLN